MSRIEIYTRVYVVSSVSSGSIDDGTKIVGSWDSGIVGTFPLHSG